MDCVGLIGKEFSEKVSSEIDEEVKSIIEGAYTTAENILKTHRKALDAIADKLIEVESLEQEEFEKLLVLHGIELKKRKEEEKITASKKEPDS